MTNDEPDNGWDSLAEDLGLEATAPTPPPEKPRTAPSRRAPASRDPRPEIEPEADDFGSGVTAESPARAALYDPGPDAFAEEENEPADPTAEPEDEGPEGDEPLTGDGDSPEEGGKRRRRRRRRRKKGGAPDGAPEDGETADAAEPAPEAAEAGAVEAGEAPAEFEGDDDDEAPPSLVDEEMDAEAARPRPEWQVMTWNELVSKLYRPG